MRRGHKSGGPQQRFDAHPDEVVVLMLIEHYELIPHHGAERQEGTAASAFDGPLPAPLKEVLEQAVERFDRLGA
jgi:hypothetical protein